MFKSGFVTAPQLTIYVYPVHIYHSYWPWLELAAEKLGISMVLEWPYNSKFAVYAPIFVIKALHKLFVWASFMVIALVISKC